MFRLLTIAGLLLCFVSGCGTLKGRSATEQLLVSDAVDQSIEQIDFGPLAGEDVFLDVQFIRAVRSVGFVNSEYIISSLRQRMIGANCRLLDSRDEAKYVVEVRIGALGSDCHEINYGVPGSQALNQTASLVSSAPLPAVPEISLARTDECRAAAKISLFAYERETKSPVWESGPSHGVSLAKSTWVLGAGPFQEGDIYDKAEELLMIELPEVQDARLSRTMIAALRQPFKGKRLRSRNGSGDAIENAAPAARVTQLAESKVPALKPVPSHTSKIMQASATEPVTENEQEPEASGSNENTPPASQSVNAESDSDSTDSP